MRPISILLRSAIAALLLPLALAAAPRELPTVEAQRAFDTYSAALSNPDLGWEQRVEVLRARGALLSNHFQLEEALIDFRAARELAPHYSLTHLDVATALTKLGRYPEAYRSFKAGFHANPANLVLFMTRGMTHFNDRKYTRAVRDFNRHLKFHPRDAYRMLWLYLAEEHRGGDGSADLRAKSAALDSAAWPHPLVELYLGERSVSDVLRVASRDQGPGVDERRCEAYFFIAQLFALRGDETEAKAYFERTVDTGVQGFMEYATARLELERMDQ